MLTWYAVCGIVLVKLKGFQKLTNTDEALSSWLNALQIKKPKQTAVALEEALGRVLAEDVVAKDDLPRFDKSAVDGYAIKFEDSIGASQFKPAIFQLTENSEIQVNQAKQVWTGNPIPKGANASVMLENTKKLDDKLEVWSQLAPGDNISRKGEDVNKGEIAAKAGTRLNPYHIALAAALGYSELQVYTKPKIAILATGNELAEIGTTPEGNQIFDSNKIMLSAICQELGAETIDCGIAKDNLEEIVEKIKKALQTSDALITTGGTSVGGLDLVPDAVNSLGKPGVIAHGMALRPAMPTALGVLEDKPVMILSGNPVAAVVGFALKGAAVGFQRSGDSYGIDNDEVGFGGGDRGGHFFQVVKTEGACTSAFHLLKIVAAFDVAHEEQAFERFDVGAGGDHVNGDGDSGVVLVAEAGKQRFWIFV